jgi:5'-3' exonuclease
MYLSNDKGEQTSVAYGLLNMLRTLLEQNDIKEVCICWDYKGYASKRAIYPEYKQNRAKKHGEEGTDHYNLYLEIIKQIDELYAVLPAFGIKQLRREGIEADDLIGLLCEELIQRKKTILVVSGDQDLFQLVDRCGVTVYYPVKDVYITKENFEKEVGIHPSLFIFMKCLIGDTGDNIKGVGGFGEKTAPRLLKAYGPWTDWFVDGHPKGEILMNVNKSQKARMLNINFLDTLILNFNLMSVGYLDADKMGDVILDYYGQKAVLDEATIRQFFLDKQFSGHLAKYRSWLHQFMKLHYREATDENVSTGTQGDQQVLETDVKSV